MKLLARLRLLDAKLSHTPIGVWQNDPPAMRDGEPFAWMLNPDGQYTYRPMTEAEQLDAVEKSMW